MKTLLTKILLLIALPLLAVSVSSCGTDDPEPTPPVEKPAEKPDTPDNPDDPTPDPEPEPEPEPNPVPEAPAPCDNKVVAHRGGAKEAGENIPDNSIAALEYTMNLGCYASECDIYLTSDNRVIVAHGDGDGKVNGLYPYESTLQEIRDAGTLSNGEQIPTLEDYLDHLMVEGSCTKLWIDIKNVTQPETLTYFSGAAGRFACRIVAEKKAEKWVEFICTGNETVMNECAPEAKKYGIPIGWMANRPATTYQQLGYEWANMSVSNMTDATHSGERTVDEFTAAGVALSVYNVDKAKNMRYYIARLDQMKAICTNYPSLLLQEMKN